ncbi:MULTISPECIES: phytanoyl-CoA dioxygenase family protein [unclassified Arcicella]|uniref:phytanoyl-CoA dioxygenase family protein n=1 Tax=unclassified Arcicella TaxID=2644986 RepID=UPI002855AF9E|nr:MULTISPECIES: phytanoyl-CoA dioxygenase family protein [unclassified Arcicella]MDR6560155.1 ectoine hydroxylase-related dioxygenase (phytanoyl-CoA dioxygenase family) [Arcicella sp. BE51]MDR6810238.1 ectoine hydroxylase-related dioxygenase (phytanoyl-CoA dioxygenase family) [Arcicella sp. BE140]MDR6821588.1 ectoine hydroxylase-related dioxygenase (phytanoyl-CoA dioxygenase family) [Arcicella sp. BE139]
MNLSIYNKINNDGFAILDNVFSDEEINNLLSHIEQVGTIKDTFRKTKDLFAIRQFFKEVPDSVKIIFSAKLRQIITEIFDTDYFVVKSIYFDKPEDSNWFVAYHQDLTISVDKKVEIEGFDLWTNKQNQFAVHPPIDILEDNFTIRIHLDDTDEANGALKIVPTSHLKGIYKPETIDWAVETETICSVKKGGIMFMKPLLLHASNRTTNNKKRRVLHIEFSRKSLPQNLNWSELLIV